MPPKTQRSWLRPLAIVLALAAGAALIFLLTRLEVAVEPDALRGPLRRAVAASGGLVDVCPPGAPGSDVQIASITAQRPFVGSEGTGSAIAVVPGNPPCRARIEFWLSHDSAPRRDATDRGTYRVRVTSVRPMRREAAE